MVQAISAGLIPQDLPAREKSMLAYAEKLTVSPSSISDADIRVLRGHGFSDRGILEINLAAAYMNFVNRVALGLGVEVEDSLKEFTR